jgi:hypothetical protein
LGLVGVLVKAESGGEFLMAASGLLVMMVALVLCAVILVAVAVAVGVWYTQRDKGE